MIVVMDYGIISAFNAYDFSVIKVNILKVCSEKCNNHLMYEIGRSVRLTLGYTKLLTT